MISIYLQDCGGGGRAEQIHKHDAAHTHPLIHMKSSLKKKENTIIVNSE